MMKAVVLVLVAFVSLSHEVPVEVVVGTKVVEVTKMVDVTQMVDVTTTAEPEVEMNPFGECPPEDVYLPTYLSDTKNCSVFYQCAHGVPYRMECRLPLEFNPTLNVCDYPYQSGCLLKVVESETDDEEENTNNDGTDDQDGVETANKDETDNQEVETANKDETDNQEVETANKDENDNQEVETANKDETDDQEVEMATKVVVLPAEADINVFAPVVGQVEVVDSVLSSRNRNNHN